jgi:hypothetical protein
VKKTVCVDLDGVLADYSEGWQGTDHIGDPIPGAVEFTRKLAATCKIVVFTTRCKADLFGRDASETVEALTSKVKAWLDRHGFAYDEIYAGQGKPIAVAYVDDRAVVCRPQVDDDAFGAALLAIQDLIQ